MVPDRIRWEPDRRTSDAFLFNDTNHFNSQYCEWVCLHLRVQYHFAMIEYDMERYRKRIRAYKHP